VSRAIALEGIDGRHAHRRDALRNRVPRSADDAIRPNIIRSQCGDHNCTDVGPLILLSVAIDGPLAALPLTPSVLKDVWHSRESSTL
jgi:hypothetical protein